MKKQPIDKKTGAKVAQYVKLKSELDAKTAAYNKEKERLSRKMAVIESDLINNMKQQEVERLGDVSLKKEDVFNIADYDKFTGYVKKHNAFYMFQKRLSNAVFREMLKEGEISKAKLQTQLGIGSFTKESLHITKKRGVK